MDQITGATGGFIENFGGLWTMLVTFATSLMRPWNAYQVLIASGIFILAHLIDKYTSPLIYGWMRTREGWPMWRMRWMVTLHKRLRGIVFVLLIWLTVAIMREATWPSRSYLLAIGAKLALAWLIVTLGTRLIANSALRSVVRYGAWIWVTVSILNLTDDFVLLAESISIDAGTMHISLWKVLQALFILGALFFGARFVTRTLADRIQKNDALSPSMRVLSVKLMQFIVFGVALAWGLKASGLDLTGLAVLSGAIGVGLGFGLQKVVSNLVSGVILLLDKSIKPGDVISLGDTFGWINSLGARYVSITTRDGKEYLIPNEDLITGQVVNWTHADDFVRLDIHFGTSYDDDPHLVRAVAIAAATGVKRVLSDKKPVCHITGFGDSSVDYVLRFWISDPTQGLTNIRGDVYLALWDAFQENSISIPFPQREIRLLSEETPHQALHKGRTSEK